MTIDRLSPRFIILLTSLLVAGHAGIEAGSQETDAESADNSSLIKHDLAGRTALMDQINRALEMESFTTAERLVQTFREKYPSDSGVRGWDNGNEVVYLYHAVYQLGQHHAAIGDLRKTLEVYEDELRSLSLQIPHYSWRFVGLKVPLLLELGLQTPGQIQSMLEEHKDGFERRAEEVEHPGRVELFKNLASRMTSAIRHVDLIGKAAPSFNFTHSYNAELPLSLERFRGKIVLLDFWATWCAPCMEAWPSLRDLHQQYKDRGFEILSVTSLQGSFGAEKGISPEREIELTKEFLDKHDVNWPILFSDRSVNDPEYGTTTLPSYVILNHEGKVERVLIGEFSGLGETILDRLFTAGRATFVRPPADG